MSASQPEKARSILLHRQGIGCYWVQCVPQSEDPCLYAEHVPVVEQAALDQLEVEYEHTLMDLDCERSVLAMTVARLAGTVEGAPTHRGNFLQRIEELRKIETRLAARDGTGG